MSVRGYWFAFAIGVSAGAAVALLYAPQSGEKTRKRLREQADHAGEYIDDASDYLKNQAERLGNEAQTAHKQGKGRVSAVVGTAKDRAASDVQSAKSLV